MKVGPQSEAAPVFVTGLGIRCAIGSEVRSFAKALRSGQSGIRPLGEGREGCPRFAALLEDFDFGEALASRKGLPDIIRRKAMRYARRSPRPVQAAVLTAIEAWDNAQLHQRPCPAERIGVVVAGSNLTSRYEWELTSKFLENPAYLRPSFALQYLDTDHIGTVSSVLDIRGEGYTVGGASASGNVGIINGSRLIESGAVDVCLVLGALTDLSPIQMRSFVNLGAMAGASCSDEGGGRNDLPAAPFDDAHSGFVYGQACACLVLESGRSAHLRGAETLVRLDGYAQRLDGSSLPDPSEEGEAAAMAQAIARAGLAPKQVSYVNAHGTGSPLGDITEIQAIRRVFDHSERPWINATKGLTGHSLCAAGVVEAVAVVVQMRERFIHPNRHLRRPIDQDCRFAGPQAEPAEVGAALSNSFGFGGFNTSILLTRV